MTLRITRSVEGTVGRFLLVAVLTALAGCGPGEAGGGAENPDDPGSDSEAWEGDIEAVTRVLRPHEGTERDWEIFRSTVEMAWAQGLDTLPMGDAMARIGQSFVGWPYEPHTLELAGDEAVVINLEAFDCVTLVENVLALARFIKLQDPSVLDSEAASRAAYTGAIRELRYRQGKLDGYPSRLHYFSDWIRDNQAKGFVREITQELGGVPDPRAIDFMTSHPEAYRQLANPDFLAAVQEAEWELSGLDRFKLPEGEIQTWMSWIQDGDIIAATSTVDGLDVAHTGLAYWQDGHLHLLHAPLVGEEVEISRLPLAERIMRLSGQDGIRIVRPLEPSGAAGPVVGGGQESPAGMGEGPGA